MNIEAIRGQNIDGILLRNRLDRKPRSQHLTIALKELVKKLNPCFRDEKMDQWLKKDRIEEKTFIAIADIINVIFHLDFSPEQIKARYHHH